MRLGGIGSDPAVDAGYPGLLLWHDEPFLVVFAAG
jgi:hypothetical protein